MRIKSFKKFTKSWIYLDLVPNVQDAFSYFYYLFQNPF